MGLALVAVTGKKRGKKKDKSFDYLQVKCDVRTVFKYVSVLIKFRPLT